MTFAIKDFGIWLSLFTCCPNALSVDRSNMPPAAPWVRILPYRQNNSEQLYSKENIERFLLSVKNSTVGEQT